MTKHPEDRISSRELERNKRSRSRSPHRRRQSINGNYGRESKPKLTKEQREKRLQEMKDNAQELDSTIQDLDRRFKKQDKKETEELKRNLKKSEEYMFKEIVKLSSMSSLESNLKERKKLSNIDKYFKSWKLCPGAIFCFVNISIFAVFYFLTFLPFENVQL